ncbi:MAG: G5 domain-containing protein [Micromonosporaceae bacterium]
MSADTVQDAPRDHTPRPWRSRRLWLLAAVTATLLVACESPDQPSGSGDAIAVTESASPSPSPTPSVEKRLVTETSPISYGTRKVNDSAMSKGTYKVRTKGVAGVKTLTYEVTYVDGVETEKRLVRETVTRAPVTEVIAVGTKVAPKPVAPKCDPNYSGGCVPIASDVDCAGGSGNGPAYVKGPVRVIGNDIYGLDRDNDGIGCE